jgi:co-chaperonin GroES (HSP10)
VSRLRPFADNVLIVMEPPEVKTASGLHVVHDPDATSGRIALVLESGAGHYNRLGVFIKNEVKPGDRVVVGKYAGHKKQDYRMDFYKPRQNDGTAFGEWADKRGDFRLVRHDECLAIVGELEA